MTSKSIDAERKSLFAQTLIIHVILTNKIPSIQSRANWPLFLTPLIIVAVGAWPDGFAAGEHARIRPAPTAVP